MPCRCRAVSACSPKGRDAFQLLDVSSRGQILGAQLTVWTEIRARARGSRRKRSCPPPTSRSSPTSPTTGRRSSGRTPARAGARTCLLPPEDGRLPSGVAGRGRRASHFARTAAPCWRCWFTRRRSSSIVVPTGAGEARTLEPGPVVRYTRAVFDNTGRKVVFSGIDSHDAERVFVQDLDGGPAPGGHVGRRGSAADRPARLSGWAARRGARSGRPARPLSPGRWRSPCRPGPGRNRRPDLLDPGRPRAAGGALRRRPRPESSTSTSRADEPGPGTGSAARPRAGLQGQYRILVTPDGESYAYSYTRQVNDLYLTSPSGERGTGGPDLLS